MSSGSVAPCKVGDHVYITMVSQSVRKQIEAVVVTIGDTWAEAYPRPAATAGEAWLSGEWAASPATDAETVQRIKAGSESIEVSLHRANPPTLTYGASSASIWEKFAVGHGLLVHPPRRARERAYHTTEELPAAPDSERVAQSALLKQMAEMRQEILELRGKLERTKGGPMATAAASSAIPQAAQSTRLNNMVASLPGDGDQEEEEREEGTDDEPGYRMRQEMQPGIVTAGIPSGTATATAAADGVGGVAGVGPASKSTTPNTQQPLGTTGADRETLFLEALAVMLKRLEWPSDDGGQCFDCVRVMGDPVPHESAATDDEDVPPESSAGVPRHAGRVNGCPRVRQDIEGSIRGDPIRKVQIPPEDVSLAGRHKEEASCWQPRSSVHACGPLCEMDTSMDGRLFV